MRRVLRWAGYAAGGLVVIAAALAAYIWIASSQKLNARVAAQPEKLAGATAAELADGQRQLKVLGCVSCHGAGLRGNLFFDEPKIARLYAPNLTLVAAIASDQQLAQGIRQGIGHDGRSLFAMPSAQYARLTDGEVAALVAAIRDLPRGGEQTPPVGIGPLGRVGIVTGKFKPQPELVADYAQKMPADLGPQFARGRHLVMTNCAECHGPALGGGEPKPGLKAPGLEIAGAYDLEQFKRLMRDGAPPSGRDLDMMDDISRNDLRHLTDEEIAAIHGYLAARAERAR